MEILLLTPDHNSTYKHKLSLSNIPTCSFPGASQDSSKGSRSSQTFFDDIARFNPYLESLGMFFFVSKVLMREYKNISLRW